MRLSGPALLRSGRRGGARRGADHQCDVKNRTRAALKTKKKRKKERKLDAKRFQTHATPVSARRVMNARKGETPAPPLSGERRGLRARDGYERDARSDRERETVFFFSFARKDERFFYHS